MRFRVGISRLTKTHTRLILHANAIAKLNSHRLFKPHRSPYVFTDLVQSVSDQTQMTIRLTTAKR